MRARPLIGSFHAAAAGLAGALSIASASGPIEGIGPTGPVERVATGFAFTEGPAYGGGRLYFTDIPNQRVHVLDAGGRVTTFLKNSRHANGLMFARGGELLACEMDGSLVAYTIATRARRELATTFQGVRFNAPNDLVIDSQGGVYFTDPRFRAPETLPQGGQHVYYLSANSRVVRVTPDLPAPNGVLLSRDEKTLYVLPSDSPVMRSYPIVAPGRVGEGRPFCRVRQPPGGGDRGSDGAALDERGNLYLTTHLGVQVFSEEGEYRGAVPLPEKPANVTFGGEEGRTLYATARTSVYALPMAVRGWRHGGLPARDRTPAVGDPPGATKEP